PTGAASCRRRGSRCPLAASPGPGGQAPNRRRVELESRRFSPRPLSFRNAGVRVVVSLRRDSISRVVPFKPDQGPLTFHRRRGRKEYKNGHFFEKPARGNFTVKSPSLPLRAIRGRRDWALHSSAGRGTVERVIVRLLSRGEGTCLASLTAGRPCVT